jgi:UPF0716 protein FxsA
LSAVLTLVLLFVVAPIIEIFGIVRVGHSIGGLATFGLLVLGAVLGAMLVKYEGVRLFQRFLQQIAARRVPSAEIADGVVILVAGGLLIAPGFISDAVALILLIPPVRRRAGQALVRRYTAKGGRSRVIRATYSGPIDAASYDAGFGGGPSDRTRPPGQLPPASDDDETP